MDLIEKLNKAAQEITNISSQINDQINNDVYKKAPLVIHQRFCSELVAISKKNEGVKLKEFSEFTDLMTAIDVLEKLYPNLK